jgi:predicted regulator of Ras-like GTPase activity (Roadblock/LC7/MglB family)
MTPSVFAQSLAPLARQRGVRAAIVVEEREGLVIDAVAHVDVDAEALAALAALLYRQVRRASLAAGLGETRFFQLEADAGHICGVAHDDMLLVALAEPQVAIGRLRIEMLRAAAALS